MAKSTILVVDDSPEMHRLYRIALNRPEYRLLTATSGSGALLAMGMHMPDVILLDLAMPEMDGIAFLKVLRQTPEWQDVPVIVLSAFGTGGDFAATQQLDVAEHFVKGGFSLKELRARIDACLGASDGVLAA